MTVIARLKGIDGLRVETTYKQTCHQQRSKGAGIGMRERGHRAERSSPAAHMQQALSPP